MMSTRRANSSAGESWTFGEFDNLVSYRSDSSIYQITKITRFTNSADAHMSDLSFTAFVLSLASTAAIHFGDLPDPATGERSPSRTSKAPRR